MPLIYVKIAFTVRLRFWQIHRLRVDIQNLLSAARRRQKLEAVLLLDLIDDDFQQNGLMVFVYSLSFMS
jgi:hypothetical protein